MLIFLLNLNRNRWCYSSASASFHYTILRYTIIPYSTFLKHFRLSCHIFSSSTAHTLLGNASCTSLCRTFIAFCTLIFTSFGRSKERKKFLKHFYIIYLYYKLFINFIELIASDQRDASFQLPFFSVSQVII
jgi:hypothetical protein